MDNVPLFDGLGQVFVNNALSYTFLPADLAAVDPDTPPELLRYTLTTPPEHGTLHYDGVELLRGDTFTQAAVDAGLVSYQHDGSAAIDDGFTFTLEDETTVLPEMNFAITIAPTESLSSPQQTQAAAEPDVLEVRISDGNDDVEERASGSVSMNSSDLEMADDGTKTGQTVGLRFTGLDIKPDSTIVAAYIQFQTDETDTGPTSLTIRGELGEAGAFTTASHDVTARTTTAASVNWDPDPWTDRGEAGPLQRTPDLTAIVQEIIDRDGWDALDDMVFVITGTGERTAEAYNGDANGAPLLHIEVVPPNVPNTPPVIITAAAASLPEDQTLALDVDADDNDPAGLVFSITGGADQARFGIDPATGALSFLTPPDFEAPTDTDLDNTYEAEVTVTDAGNLTDSRLFAITVTDAPENTPPTITTPAAASLPEDQTLALDVDANDNDPAGLVFSITGGADQARFGIDPATGALSFLTPPDFEAPTDADLDNTYEVNVTVTDAGNLTDSQSITVTVLDAAEPDVLEVRISDGNDDVEERASGSVSMNSSDLEMADDGTKTGQTVGLRFTGLDIKPDSTIVAAYIQFQTDETDTGPTSLTIRGELGEAGAFTTASHDVTARTTTAASVNWDPDPWTDRGEAGPLQRTPDLTAIVQEIIDRDGWDALDDMVFVITGTGERTAEAYNGDANGAPLLHIEVVPPNVPNTPPVIITAAAASLPEDQTLALDVDADDNDPAGLVFSITGGADQARFGIDPATGALSFLTPPDFEAPTDTDLDNTYEAEVTVTDAGNLTDSRLFAITVTDAPENTPPTITTPAAASLPEDQTLALDVDANDNDPAGLVFSITGGADQARFGIDPATGALSFLTPPDFEAPTDADLDNTYEVNVTVTDAGNLTDSRLFAITVTDAPEGPPAVFQKQIAFGLDDVEERASGWPNLNSSDLEIVDDSSNQTIGLRFTGIDIPVGATITNAYIQFEVDEVSLGTANFLIEGEATDDAAPFANLKFDVSSRSRTDASIAWSPPEWLAKGDTGIEQRTPNLAAVVQEIVSRSGWAALADMVFIITGAGKRVADAFEGEASGAAILSIEYTPTASTAERVVFDLVPDADPALEQVNEFAAAGTAVGISASATDPTPGDIVTYSVEDTRFNVDPNSGALTRSGTGHLDFETEPQINVTVTAISSDGTSDARTFTLSVLDDPETVAFQDPPDTDPTFDRVNEAAAPGTLIGITAYAEDFDPGDTVTYSVTDPRFAIDPITGVVTRSNQGDFDWTTEKTVSLDVTAVSSDGSVDVETFLIDVVPSAATTIMRFAAVGDWGEPDYSGEQAVADMIDSWNVDLILALGDYSYLDTVPFDDTVGAWYADYIANYTGAYGSGATINRFFPVLGNHEYSDDPAGLNNGIDVYLDYFTLPDNERYYDFRIGDAHFFALNSNWREPDGEESNSIQAQWYEQAILASDASVKITYFHHTPYSDGAHDSPFMRWDFESFGADAIFAGHDHDYYRVLRDDDGDGTDLPYITSGRGGADHDPPDAGANLVTITDRGTLIEFYTVDGILRDSYFVETKDGQPVAEEDVLIGTIDEDYLWGLGGDDTLNGGAGDDVLIGGLGDDVFIFEDIVDNDTVHDFVAGDATDDRLDLTAFGIENLFDFSAVSQDQDGNVIADLTASDSITLIGVQLADMSDHDFVTTLIA